MNICEDILAFIKYPTNTISFNFIGDTANLITDLLKLQKKANKLKCSRKILGEITATVYLCQKLENITVDLKL
jgi:hypothetical protein